MKRKKKKKNWLWVIILLVVLVGVGVGAYFVGGKILARPVPTQKTASSASNSPTKTSKKDGYIAPSTQKAAVGSADVVADAGSPEWVKVPSTQKLEKFTDLSTGGLTIYRINNPEVLKTTTQLQQPLLRMADMISQYPNTLIMNASAFDMENTNQVVGLQINNGKLIRDWNPTSTSTQYAFIINKDGSCKIYDSTTPASTIIKNGAAQSYDFGTALIRDGKTVPSDGSVNWEIHAFIANDKSNNLYVILSDTNAGYDNIMKGVASLHLENMLLLDSGGSSQLSVKGKTIVASQDNRAVPDYIVMK